jgi:hypothetical protein
VREDSRIEACREENGGAVCLLLGENRQEAGMISISSQRQPSPCIGKTGVTFNDGNVLVLESVAATLRSYPDMAMVLMDSRCPAQGSRFMPLPAIALTARSYKKRFASRGVAIG